MRSDWRAYNQHTSQKRLYCSMYAGMLFVCLLGPAFATPLSPSLAATQSFLKYDTNRDNFVSLEEFKTCGAPALVFAIADVSQDGKLTEEEFNIPLIERVKVAEFVEDSVITAKVKTYLLKESSLKGIHFHIETNQGAVQLRGVVHTKDQIATALQTAAGVKGVSKVVNSLTLMNQ